MLAGVKRLTRLALRRDRITVPVTLLLAVGMTAGSAPALVSAYSGYEEQLSYVASSVTSVVGRMFQGTIQGVSIGSILIAETFIFTAVILAVMSIMIVTRHTRHNEETGAGELIGSMIVGRSSPLTSALIVAVLANLLAGLLMFAVIASTPEFDVVGTAFFSLALALSGIFFAGVAAITAQISDYRRGANMMAIGFLIVSFVIFAMGAALGDITPDGLGVDAHWSIWLSPLGWANQILPYYDNAVLPLVMLAIGFVVTAGVGYFLLHHRDLGSSIIPSRAGRKRAKQSLLRNGGLARKLLRPSLLAWTAGAVLWGAMMGAVVTDFRSTFEENEVFQEFLSAESSNSNFTELMFSTMLPLMGAMLAGYVVTALSKMQDEEGQGRIEFLLSTTLNRVKWLGTYIITTVTGIAIALLGLGVSSVIGYFIAADEREVSAGDIMLSALSSFPAMLLFMAVVVLVFAIFGRWVKTFAWSFFAYCVLIGSFAGIFKWPEWTTNLSPFTHTPAIPAESIEYQPLIVMTVLSVVIGVLALYMFRRRDLNLK